jgi:transposase
MNPTPKAFVGFIGCDVGKSHVIVFDSRCGRTVSLLNQPEALADWAARIEPGYLVVCEATGGYEAALLAAVSAAGLSAHRADARKVKAFIRSFGTLGKTDAIDARALAGYGRERHAQLAFWRPSEAECDRLHALVTTRTDLVAARQACRNRLAAPGGGHVRAHLQPLLDCLSAQIAAIEAAIEAALDAHPTMRVAAQILRAIPGVGPTTAATLLALMPELGQLNRRQAAALAGLAPHPRQSGTLDAYRRTRGGRPQVKRAIFMAALSAVRHNKPLTAFYERLIANGKKKLVAITAVMRKLIVIANAKIRQTQPAI